MHYPYLWVRFGPYSLQARLSTRQTALRSLNRRCKIPFQRRNSASNAFRLDQSGDFPMWSQTIHVGNPPTPADTPPPVSCVESVDGTCSHWGAEVPFRSRPSRKPGAIDYWKDVLLLLYNSLYLFPAPMQGWDERTRCLINFSWPLLISRHEGTESVWFSYEQLWN